MTDRDTLLALNQAFYRAFTNRDAAAMEALWAETLPVSCIHPGWTALFGRDAVLTSWRDVLRAPGGIIVEARNERVTLHGDTALVHFMVASHLRRTQRIDYRVAVDPQRGATKVQAGAVRIAPDKAEAVVTRFPLPAGEAYRMSVRLPALDHQLWARCGGRP